MMDLNQLASPMVSAICSGLVVYYLGRSAKSRDEKLISIDDSIKELTNRVGNQNGRLGKLEEQVHGYHSYDKMENKMWDERQRRDSIRWDEAQRREGIKRKGTRK